MNNLNQQSFNLCVGIKIISWAFFTYVQFEEVLSCTSYPSAFLYSFGLSYDNCCTFADKHQENFLVLMTWIFVVWVVFSNRVHVTLRWLVMYPVSWFGGERFRNRGVRNYVYARQAMFITDVFKLLCTGYCLRPTLWKFRNNDAGLIFCVLFMAFYHEILTIFNMVNAIHCYYTGGVKDRYIRTFVEGILNKVTRRVAVQDALEHTRDPNPGRAY